MKVNINKFTGFCGCGKEHKILVKDIVIESEAIKKLPEIMEKEGFKNITIICDENTYMAAGEEVEEVMKDINDMTLAELKEMAKIKGIKGYSKLKKDELLEVLK